ncbi:MAG: hypothetical protein IJQ93_06965, partial [Bacteroidales bacterium]|nr:hypothetical protein [Bacteroidales bacterium]
MNLRLAISFILLPAILLCCGRTELDTPPDTGGDQPGKVPSSFTAFAPSGKAYIDSNLRLNWEDDDRIWVDGEKFTITEHYGSTATFTGLTDPSKNSHLAFFPYNEIYSVANSSAVLPSIQSAKPGACPWPLCYAVSEGKALYFKHLDAALRFSLGDDIDGLRNISLKGNNGETLSGRVLLAFPDGDGSRPSVSIDAPGKTVVLTGPFECGATYYINVLGLGTTFSSGLTMTFLFEDGVSCSLSNNRSVTIHAGGWLPLAEGITRAGLIEEGYGISSLDGWREFKTAYEAGSDISQWCRGGEVFLKDDIDGITGDDVLQSLDVPLNGNGKTITMDVVSSKTYCGLVGTLSASVHDLNLAGTLDYGGTGRAGVLAGCVSAPATISNVNCSADLRCFNTDEHSALAGGLVGSTTFSSGTLLFKNCSYTGELRAVQHLFALGGIIA